MKTKQRVFYKQHICKLSGIQIRLQFQQRLCRELGLSYGFTHIYAKLTWYHMYMQFTNTLSIFNYWITCVPITWWPFFYMLTPLTTFSFMLTGGSLQFEKNIRCTWYWKEHVYIYTRNTLRKYHSITYLQDEYGIPHYNIYTRWVWNTTV